MSKVNANFFIIIHCLEEAHVSTRSKHYILYIRYTKFSYDYKFQMKRFPFFQAPRQPFLVSFAAVINLSLRNGESKYY